MDDLFSDLEDEEFEDFEEIASPVLEPVAAEEPAVEDFDDEFEQLRRKSARTGSSFDDMDTSVDDEFRPDEGSGFSLNNFTTSQKLVLLALLMIDIVAVGFGLLLLLGRI
jgi:hypothetical protein